MQAFTALCGTKIMAATAILNYAKKNPDYPYFGSPQCLSKKITAPKKLNKCGGQYFSRQAMGFAARKKIVWSYFEAFL